MSPSTQTPGRDRRIEPVDAARGLAMLLVFLSHIKQYFIDSAPLLNEALVHITRVATPTFLLLSGFVIRHLLKNDARGDVSITLFDRALFLLLVAHLLLGLNDLPHEGLFRWAFLRAMITDAVGVALLVAILLRNARASHYAILGVSLYLIAWCVAVWWSPVTQGPQAIGAVFFQANGQDYPAIDAPIVPFVGVFLLGMGLNAWLERPLAERNYSFVSRRLFRYGALSVGAALTAALLWHFSKGWIASLVNDPEATATLRAFIDPRNKRPPSLGYLLFYAGTGLLLLSALFHGRPAWLMRPVMQHVSVIGRVSLVVFVVQDWVFFLLPEVLGITGIESIPFWFAWLAFWTLALYGLARIWDGAGANRYLTVGLRGVLRRHRARPARASATRIGRLKAR